MEKVLEDVFCFLVLSFIVGFLFFSVCYTQEIKHTIMLCENKKIVTETYQLAALNIETAEISKAQANGSFFLVVGTYSQKSTTELYYILRYAYIDSFGNKLQIDKIKNMSNVWIKETETQKAVPWEEVFFSTIKGSSSSSQRSAVREIQINPLP